MKIKHNQQQYVSKAVLLCILYVAFRYQVLCCSIVYASRRCLLCAVSVNHACVIPALCLFVILVNSHISIEVKTYVLIPTHPVPYVPFLSKDVG